MTPNDFSDLSVATAAPTTGRQRRRNPAGGPNGFDRKAFIAQLTQADGGLEDILAKRPADLTEADRIVSAGRSIKTAEQYDAIVRPLCLWLKALANAMARAAWLAAQFLLEHVWVPIEKVRLQLRLSLRLS